MKHLTLRLRHHARIPSLGLLAIAMFVSVHAAQAADVKPKEAERPAVAVPSETTVLPRSLSQIKETGHMTLHVREGQLLQLARPAANVLIADPTIASFQVPSPKGVFVFAQKAGTTTLYALDDKNEVIAAVRIVAEHNLKALREQIMRSVPGADIELEPALNNRMIVRGKVRTPIEAKKVVDQVQAYLDSSATNVGTARDGVVNQLKVELSSQVNIQVRVVEVSRSLTHTLGLNWAATINPKISNGTLSLATGGVTTFNAATMTGGVQLGGTFAPNSGRISSLSTLLSALSTEGMASILAEPNLTAMSGESAAFAAGGEVPIVIITNNNVQIDYKSYGVILRMTPTLLSPDRISLHIAPEVSELSSDGAVTLTGGTTIPAFKVRRADTTVELASGQSFALAGMLRSTMSQQISGVPGLSSIPWLGRLFEQENSEREQTELVILVTANVVDPVAAGELQIPGQGLPGIDAYQPVAATAGYLY